MAKKRSARTKTTTTATAVKTRKSLLRSARRSRAEQPVLDDARLVARAARQYHAGFKKYDAKRKQKLFPATRLDAFEKTTRNASILVGGKRTTLAATKAATRAEEKARAVIHAMLTEIRGVVDAGADEENVPEMRKAFLVGAKLNASSTPILVAAAADVQQAWANKKLFQAPAVALGITASTIAKLTAANRTLRDADTSQGAVRGERVGTTAEKAVALRAVERETAYIRKVAKLAFRGQPKILEAFRKKTPLAFQRARKPAASTGGGTPPAP